MLRTHDTGTVYEVPIYDLSLGQTYAFQVALRPRP